MSYQDGRDLQPSRQQMKRTLIYVYKSRQVLGKRNESYEDTISICRTLFPETSSYNKIALFTADIEDAGGAFIEISPTIWDTVVPDLRSVYVKASVWPPPSDWNLTGSRDTTPSTRITIYVKTVTGRTITMTDLNSSYLISDVADRVYALFGLPPCDQRLIFEGKQLEHDKTLIYYNIRDESKIHLITKYRGGKPVIYLRSPKVLEATVKLSIVKEWSLSAIYPVVPIKTATPNSEEQVFWRVVTHSNGDLTELNTGLNVSYLFWEALTNDGMLDSPPPNSPTLMPICEVPEAFIPTAAKIDDTNAVALSVDKITPYLDASLKALGLETEARTSFITYWLPSILKHKSVALRFLPQDSYSKAAPLEISPIPDVVTRIFMIFQGISDSELSEGRWETSRKRAKDAASIWVDVIGVDLEKTLDEKLFRVIEWGGMEVR